MPLSAVSLIKFIVANLLYLPICLCFVNLVLEVCSMCSMRSGPVSLRGPGEMEGQMDPAYVNLLTPGRI